MFRNPIFGATGFALWGFLHIIGGLAILYPTLSKGPAAGFAIYGHDGSPLPAATGGILAYFAFLIALSGLAALFVALRYNRRNSEAGLAVNTVMILAVEAGLIAFLILPGHLSVLQAVPGFAFAAMGIILGGLACKGEPGHAA